jgi:hypothetical protein
MKKLYIENPGESGLNKNNRMVGVEDISTSPILRLRTIGNSTPPTV